MKNDPYRLPRDWFLIAFGQALAVGLDVNWGAPIAIAGTGLLMAVGIFIYRRGQRSIGVD